MNQPQPRPAHPAWFAWHGAAGERRLGIVDPRGASLQFYDGGPCDTAAALAQGALDRADVMRRLGHSQPLPGPPAFAVPVERPSKILCFGKNFAAHAAEFGAEVPEEPLFFTKLVDTLTAHGSDVVLPHWVDTRIDHEIELGVILGFEDPDGRGRKNVRRAEALDLVRGYTVLNDVTARKMQGTDRGEQKPWLRCKSFDTFCPVGPWVVPADALPDLGPLEIGLSVDGALRQKSTLGLMVVDVAHGIEWLSRHTTLRPGDLIAMGTPEGVGPIAAGNVMHGWIEGIGALTNPVVREPSPR